MITQDKLIPRFSLSGPPKGFCHIVVNYVANDLGYLSELEENFIAKTVYKPAYNWTDYYLVNENKNFAECKITVRNNNADVEGLIEYLNKKPYDNFLKLRAYGLVE